MMNGRFTAMGTDWAETSPDSERADNELIASITPDVMRCLAGCNFFEELDNHLCPSDKSSSRECCRRDHAIAESILRSHQFDEADRADIFNVLRAQGGFCDCEILYNVAETSRLKAEYWRARAEGKEPPPAHNPVS
jgi:hypothetical protein